jgi:asparagine synthase (glutamine-hydrolysing)
MCSIVGYVGNANRQKISAMLTATVHRGPDDKGIYINGDIGLGHNRLSIIDLSSKGRQPMFDEEKSVCIVFNGEIYNFLELKRQLQKYYKFRTGTDTEVIIYAYKKWGFNCLKRLNGMFSFVIYDLKKNLLFGARDRLGEKPLKYYFDNNIFVFASEVKGILPVLENRPEIDYQAINDYLTLQYVPAPKTGFKNIYKLPPAHYFIFKNKKLIIRRYWNLDFSQKLDLSEKEWVNLLEDKINLAVSQRMISDVPLGAFLSGGIDSAAVVAFMAKNSNKRVKTFSIGFTEPEFDETEYSRKVSQKYDTDHSEIKVDSKIFKEIFIEMSDYYDEPFADNSLMPTIFLSKFARKKIKVALSGDGGDENFAGYGRYGVVNFSKIFCTIPRSIRNQLIKPAANTIFDLLPNTETQRLMTYVNTFDQPFYKKYLYYRCFFKKNEKHNLYSNNFKRVIGRDNTFLIYKNDFSSKLDSIDNALKFDVSSYLPEDLLFKIDIASMRYGLEVRAPLLDYKLMELSAQIPSDLKVKFFNKKYIFKKMLIEKNILPRNIVNRPKKGFVAPIKKWLKDDLKDYVYEELSSGKFRQMEIFDNGKLDTYIKEYFSSKVDYSNNIFSLLVLSSWINKYF